MQGLRIALVEDEEMIRRAMVAVLSNAGAKVDSFADPATAFEQLRSREVDIDVLVTDVVMEHGSGPELAQQLRALRNDLPVVFMSGYSAQVLPDGWAQDPRSGFVGKPFVAKELYTLIRQLLATV